MISFTDTFNRVYKGVPANNKVEPVEPIDKNSITLYTEGARLIEYNNNRIIDEKV
jgi:hypothetical protein